MNMSSPPGDLCEFGKASSSVRQACASSGGSQKYPLNDKLRSMVAVLPGLGMVTWSLWGASPLPGRPGLGLVAWLCIASTVILVLTDRALSVWNLPSLGAALWYGSVQMLGRWREHHGYGWRWFVSRFYEGFYAFSGNTTGTINWIFSGLVTSAIVLLVGWCFLRYRPDRRAARGLSWLGFAAVLYAAGQYCLEPSWWPLLLPLIVLNSAILIGVTSLALWLARRDGRTASLLVIICLPWWIAMVLRPLPVSAYLYGRLYEDVHLVAEVTLALSALQFLVLTPLRLLRATDYQAFVRQTVLSSAAALSVLCVLALWTEQGQSRLTLDWWLIRCLLALQIWLPVTIITHYLRWSATQVSRGRHSVAL